MDADFVLFSAYREVTDPGAPATSFEAARAVLQLRPDWFAAKVVTDADRFFTDVSPDRLGRLATLLGRHDSSAELEAVCLAAYRDARSAAESAPGTVPLRKAHAVAEMLVRLEAFWKLSEEDVLWLFEWDEYAIPSLVLGLEDWCRKNAITPAVSELVRSLRAEDEDSPILDRLAAAIAPSVDGMVDLAAWESAFRGCGDHAWAEATRRWEEGKSGAPEDAAALAPTLDPDRSANAEALAWAIRLHGWQRISGLLREARDAAERPVLRVISNAWLQHFGGDR